MANCIGLETCGTVEGYRRGGCRGDACKRAARLSVENWRLRALRNGGSTYVDATETRQRIEDLLGKGWTGKYLAERVGMDRSNFHRLRRCKKVRPATEQAVLALWDRLILAAPAEATPGEKMSAERNRRRFAPKQRPRYTGETVEEYRHLKRFGLDDEVIAKQLGIQLDSLRLAIRRAEVAA